MTPVLPFDADPRQPPRQWIFNLLVGDHEWLILDLVVATDKVTLRTLQRVRWDDDRVVRRSTPVRARSRRRAADALKDFERQWRADSPAADPGESALREAAFHLARKLLAPAFAELLLRGRTVGPDIALALPGEDDASVLARMHGRCRPDSVIARPRSRLGIRSFQLMRTRPK